MYQINLSLNKNNLNWFKSIEDALNLRIKEFCGLMACKIDNSRVNISIAAESDFKNQVNRVIKDTLIDMYARVCKMEYLKKNLKIPQMRKGQMKILLHTLVAFDRECERELIAAAFSVSNGIALDGIYNFRLKELKERWIDICRLTEENSIYLSDDATFIELIKFLISAINPKIQKISISDCIENYNLTGELDKEKVSITIDKDELIYYLVDLAPMEIVLIGDFRDKSMYNQIIQLFDAKQQHSKIKENYNKQ